MERTLFEADHESFRSTVSAYLDRDMVPHQDVWAEAGMIDRGAFVSAGKVGMLGMAAPIELGGGGESDFRFNAVINEEIHRRGLNGPGLALTLHNDIVLPYFLKYANEEQKRRWLPGMCDGSLIGLSP